MKADEEFVEFATVEAPRLRRMAYLLCNDWHTAQDLTQTTLASVCFAWRRINARENVRAYTQRVLVNSFLAYKRKRSATETPVDEVPDHPAAVGDLELRLVLLNALATLSPRARAVVVLRFWEDQSVDQVAEALGCSAGNVKSMTSWGLEKLREHLGDARIDLSPSH